MSVYNKTSKERGFTLIELLVVIAIIGILSSVVLASLNSARAKGRDARRISDLKQLQLALELYYDANSQTYPPGTTLSGVITPTYISTLPADPQGAAYVYQALASDNSACASGTCPSYVLKATTENTKPAGGWTTDIASISCDQTTEYCVRP